MVCQVNNTYRYMTFRNEVINAVNVNSMTSVNQTLRVGRQVLNIDCLLIFMSVAFELFTKSFAYNEFDGTKTKGDGVIVRMSEYYAVEIDRKMVHYYISSDEQKLHGY